MEGQIALALFGALIGLIVAGVYIALCAFFPLPQITNEQIGAVPVLGAALTVAIVGAVYIYSEWRD